MHFMHAIFSILNKACPNCKIIYMSERAVELFSVTFNVCLHLEKLSENLDVHTHIRFARNTFKLSKPLKLCQKCIHFHLVVGTSSAFS